MGASWRDCQKLVQHVEEDGHILTLLQRMEKFDPDTMTLRTLSKFRNIWTLGVLTPENSARGGRLCLEIAKWIQDSVRRALARFDMMQMGRSVSVRRAIINAKQCVNEAQWHAQIRQKMNDGWFIAFFGWT